MEGAANRSYISERVLLARLRSRQELAAHDVYRADCASAPGSRVCCLSLGLTAGLALVGTSDPGLWTVGLVVASA